MFKATKFKACNIQNIGISNCSVLILNSSLSKMNALYTYFNHFIKSTSISEVLETMIKLHKNIRNFEVLVLVLQALLVSMLDPMPVYMTLLLITKCR